MISITPATRLVRTACLLRTCCVTFAVLTLLRPAMAARENTQWPHVPLPQQVKTFDVGQEVVVNGTRAKISGFVSQAAPAELAFSFRRLLGQPLVEDRRGDKLILGSGKGRYYITVQLDPLGSGTRGVIAVTKPPVDREEPADAVSARNLLRSLPPGSSLATHTSSVDGRTRADHDAIVNSYSMGVNSEYVQRMLRADGYLLERDSGFSQAKMKGWHVTSYARTLFFKRAGAEAIAVLFNVDDGKSVIVLNRVYFAETTK